jgi:FMN-dependent NADH-azoreductase
LVQPGYAFTSSKEGYKGLITNRKLLIIYARGGAYDAKSGSENLDLQKRYMECIMKFIGFEDIDSIIIEPTLGSAELKEESLKKATELAKQKAATFTNKSMASS